MTTIETLQKVQEVLAQVWVDQSLKSKLLDKPKSVFAEHGLEFPEAVEVQVHENTSSLINYVLPQPGELPEEVDLQEVEPVTGHVLKRALVDECFKALLLTDPKSAIAQATGMFLPMSLEVEVYEDTPMLKHLVLLDNPAIEELNDLELEAIMGGCHHSPELIKAFEGETSPSRQERPYMAPSVVFEPSKPAFEFGY